MKTQLLLIVASALLSNVVQAADTPITAERSSNLYRLEIHTKTGEKSRFVMDTGSTGIIGSAPFFGLSKTEQDPQKCQKFHYSSSGNRYAGYIVNRDLTFGTPDKTPTKHLKDFPVFAAVQWCPKNAGDPNCTTKPPSSKCKVNPDIYMMGVGFDRPETFPTKITNHINKANPFLNLVDDKGAPLKNQNYALSKAESGKGNIDVYLASEKNPLPDLGITLELPLADSNIVPNDLAAPEIPFAIVKKSDQTKVFPQGKTENARLLPDTGIHFGIVSVSESKAPCCLSPSDGKANSIDTKSYEMQLFKTPTDKKPFTTLEYGPKQSLGQSARWSLGHPKKNSMLFNSGQLFFENCNYFYSPQEKQIILSCDKN